MRRLFVVIALSLAAISPLSGCSTFHYSPAPREVVEQQLDAILVLGQRFQAVIEQIQSAISLGQIRREAVEKVKRNADIYVIYHQAAMASLAHGQVADYLRFIELATREVAVIEMIFAKPA